MSGSELNSTVLPWTVIQMSDFGFLSINGPLTVLNLVAHVFFLFCLTTHKTQRVKQPLKTLLGFVVSSTIFYSICVTSMFCVQMWANSRVLILTFYCIVGFMTFVNMTSYVWLMFYYYIMIVPSQRAIIRWVKKNIKSVIYVVLFVDRLMFAVNAWFQMSFISDNFNFNVTEIVFKETDIAALSIINLYIYFSLCVMTFSSFTTAHYLSKHMKSLAASDGSLFNPRLRSQIRVTITGILQGVLYCLYAMWYTLVVLTYFLPLHVTFDFYTNSTATTLYISFTTLNLWVGQTLFRERAVHVWKAVKKHISAGKEDLTAAKDPSTTLDTIQSTGADLTDG